MDKENLPYSIDSEQALLGACLTDRAVITRVADTLKPDCFYVPVHGKLYALFLRLFLSGIDYDTVSLIDIALREQIFDTADDARSYLLKLSESTMTTAGAEQYARIISDKALLRHICEICTEIYEKAKLGTDVAAEVLDFAEQKIYELRDSREVKGLAQIKNAVLEKYNAISALRANPDALVENTTSTSFHELDNYIYGLNNTDLIVLAARPGMGKTSFALNIAVNTAKRYRGKKIAVFSFEMSTEQLVTRLMSSEALVPSENLRNGQLDDDMWERLQDTVAVLARLELYVDETPNVSIAEMKAKLRRMDGIGLVVIDYLQLMSTGKFNVNRVNDISELTRNIKIMAKELNVPVVLLSQLSRGVENRDDKHPHLSDLRDSGSIEQDADIVLFLYNDNRYNPDNGRPNDYECIIAKNRQGSTGTIPLYWDGRFTKFTSVARGYE